MISWSSITQGMKIAKKYAVKYAPQILTGVGIVMMTGATIHAIKVSPAAKECMNEIDDDPELTHKDYILKKTRAYAEFYWPTLLMTFGGAGLIIGGQHINLRRLGVATAIISSQREELKDIKEKLGDKEFDKIQDQITKDKVQTQAATQNLDISTVYNTGKGNMLCYDIIGKRFFLSDLEFIRQMRDAFNSDISEQMQRGQEAVMSLNDWYGYIELPPLDGYFDDSRKKFGPNIGKDLGWRNRTMQLKFTSGILGNDQTYFAIGFTESGMPKWDLDISDDYGSSYEDDSTDMPWRGK